MNDRGEGDDKIICILPSDPSVVHISDIDQVPFSLKEEIKHFFQQYTSLEGKAVKVDDFYDKIEALKTIEASLVRYETKFGSTF
jgi:inorganic pyrophosphatase